jgi:hypothetical protein
MNQIGLDGIKSEKVNSLMGSKSHNFPKIAELTFKKRKNQEIRIN